MDTTTAVKTAAVTAGAVVLLAAGIAAALVLWQIGRMVDRIEAERVGWR